MGRNNTYKFAFLLDNSNKEVFVMKNRIEAINILAETGTLEQIITNLVYNDPISASLVYAIANYPGTPSEVLAILANDKDWEVRYAVAGNSNTSPETLAVLATDEYCSIRAQVGNNPNTLPETLEKLAGDKEYWVRENVAYNHKASLRVLTILAKDENWLVRSTASKNLSFSYLLF